jgi:hypothetical protein
MIQDDFLLRQIAQITTSLLGIRKQFEVDAEALESTSLLESGAKELTGMSLGAIDRLPAQAVIGGLRSNPDGFSERAMAIAELLSLAAIQAERLGDDGLAMGRRQRADVFLAAAMEVS